MNLDDAIQRSMVGLQAESDQIDSALVDDLTDDIAFLGFIGCIRLVNESPENLRKFAPRDLEIVAYLFSRSAVPIIEQIRQRRKELKGTDDCGGGG